MIDSSYSTVSFAGFVSSNRRLHDPLYSAATPKFRQIDLACPMCKYPFGSGGKRVCTRPLFLLALTSSATRVRMKSKEGADSRSGIFIMRKNSILAYAFDRCYVASFRACPGKLRPIRVGDPLARYGSRLPPHDGEIKCRVLR